MNALHRSSARDDDAALLARFRALARTLAPLRDGLDREAYAAAGLDPLEPVIGLGPANAPLCFFGRDPGRTELQLRQPFVGDAGRLLRRGLLPPARRDAASDDDLLAAGAPFFWLNIVPYKPRGNAVWPAPVRQAFRPLVLHCLLARWRGDAVVTLGQHAFEWFASGQPPGVRQQLRERWSRVLDATAGPVEVRLAAEGHERVLRLHPLPHPSPANVIGRRAFPELLEGCLAQFLPRHSRGGGNPRH